MTSTVARRVSRVSADERGAFLGRTYTHLGLAVAGLIAFELALFQSGLAQRLAAAMARVPWLAILGAFMLVGWLTRRAAHHIGTLGWQYVALVAYVVAKGLLLVPLLYAADRMAGGVIQSAGLVTGLGFTGLTWVVFQTRKDFSFLRPFLSFLGICALAGLIASFIFGFRLGPWFSVAMVVLAGGSVLSDTSALLRHYTTDKYVAGALELFASMSFMFWYVLRLYMRQR